MLIRATNTKGEWAYFDPERVELVEQDDYQDDEINIFLQDSALSVSKKEWKRLAPILGITLLPSEIHDLVYETIESVNDNGDETGDYIRAICETCGAESAWVDTKEVAEYELEGVERGDGIWKRR